MERCSGRHRTRAASSGGTEVGEGDDLKEVGPDPQCPYSCKAFQVASAARVGAHADHFPVYHVHGVECLTARDRDCGPCGGKDRAPGCLQGYSGAGISEKPGEVLPHGGSGDPHLRPPCRRPKAGGGEEGEEDAERAAVLENWLHGGGAEATE